MRKKIFAVRMILLICITAGVISPPRLWGQERQRPLREVRLTLSDSLTSEPLTFTYCLLKAKESSQIFYTISDKSGVCVFRNLAPGEYDLSIIYWGQTIRVTTLLITESNTVQVVRTNLQPLKIGEVEVMAKGVQGPYTASVIGKDAISHIQPSSIADLLELIPGGRSSDPYFSGPNVIRLREAENPVSTDQSTNSMGVQFLIDGVPVSMDANMQSSPALTSTHISGFVNNGVDMRSISADDIESVEIVRGIPSAEYGDLTAGLLNIKRKQGGRNINVRIKSDMTSKLVHAGKGFEWGGEDRLTMNVGADWLEAKSDPRNTRRNYTRATGNFRMGKTWSEGRPFRYYLGGSVEYTGSFQKRKSDEDIDKSQGTYQGPIETYRTDYNRFFTKLDFSISAKDKSSFFRRFETTASVTAEYDEIEHWKYVRTSVPTALKTFEKQGEYDAVLTTGDYGATLLVEGKPFYGYAKAMAVFGVYGERSRHEFKAGASWTMNKNYGRGNVFDPYHPISFTMSLRTRPFSDIPATHQTAIYIEDLSKLTVGGFHIEWMAGVRAAALMNLGDKYDINGRFYFDPRFNLRVRLPEPVIAGRPLRITVGGGTGYHTKMPSISQLFQEPVYIDIQQFNSYSGGIDNPANRINFMAYKIDPVNYSLKPARNFKWEVSADFEYAGNRLSVTYFNETMNSGFRTVVEYGVFEYKQYDVTQAYYGPDGRPSLAATPYVVKEDFGGWYYYANGSRTRKEGVEFTLTTARIRPIYTRLTINGAYFRTRYDNSMAVLERPSVILDNRERFPYIGLYMDDDAYLRESLNTNFTFDTQIPRLGLIFTTSFQCMWFRGSEIVNVDPRPVSYAGKDLVFHPYTDESAADGVLTHLIRSGGSADRFTYDREPFYMLVNLKVTKNIFRDRMSLSVFANKIISHTPSYYTRDGNALRRRYVTPYFGMELNFKL